MADASATQAGAVASLWRYPVKSMMGEELTTVRVTGGGLLGDRAWGLIDGADGKVATAKNPRKWPNLFAFRAAFTNPSEATALRITLPDSTVVTAQMHDVNAALSAALGRAVTLASTARHGDDRQSARGQWPAQAEEYWPDMEGLDHRDTVTDFELPEGTFFDCATVHVLTTATLEQLRKVYPHGRFEPQRFRPNIVVQTADTDQRFVEDSWIGQTLAIGDEVRLQITGPCGRCVMTTLAQGDLPKDAGILRAAVEHHRANVGVYAAVVRGGAIRCGDRVVVTS